MMVWYPANKMIGQLFRELQRQSKYDGSISRVLSKVSVEGFQLQAVRTHVTRKKSKYLFHLRSAIYNTTFPQGKPGLAQFYIPPTKDQIFDRHRTRVFSTQEKQWRKEVKREIREHFVGRKSYKYHKKMKERFERKFPHSRTNSGRFCIRQPPKEVNLPLPRWGPATTLAPEQSTNWAPRVKRRWYPEDYDMETWKNKLGKVEQAEVLNFKLDYSHPVLFRMPEEVKALVLEPTLLCLYGVDKTQVETVASKLRALQPPNVYTGHGIRTLGEKVSLRARSGQKK
eukprot:TRINITY_DN3938_c0_g1_i1.p1 TRINITY_DN3938_c0_g1~~TRINITY_DN3938_c0_g1_i1.p1  ORF type:complete len:284 (-),score=45.19 TRINITY_DN3938_c0_g1_i1:170-1021(-)